ncbi:MAG TPA: hypothetical protein VKB26_08785 [Candidatus Acidoferrales bacterium]|nr:hypothetical protein [Candidatus Acidoferrales bacterium]
MRNRTRKVGLTVTLLGVVGSIGFVDLAQRPRFANFHTVDVLQLLGTGMCYGVALALLGLVRKKSAE